MKKTQFDSLQYVFACLFTHSRWIQSIRQNYACLSDYFHLSDHDNQLLYDFMQTNFKKIFTSAVLSEEKRWRELLTTIKFSASLLQPDKLKRHWDNYLHRFSPIQAIPATPILESLLFLNHLMNQPLAESIKPIVEYEYFRNRTFAYEFPSMLATDLIDRVDFNLQGNQLATIKAQMNPSFTSKIFERTLTTILTNVYQRHDFPDYIGFYKNRRTGKVKSIFLNEAMFAFLYSVPSFGNVASLIENYAETKHCNLMRAANAIKQLHEEGIIFLTNLS